MVLVCAALWAQELPFFRQTPDKQQSVECRSTLSALPWPPNLPRLLNETFLVC